MKKFLFALPVLALAIFLSYCAKESSPTSGIQNEQQADPAAADRACTVYISASDNVTVCGLGTFGNCTSCSGANLPGTAFGTAFGYSVMPPALGTPFSITNNTANAVDVRIYTGAACGVWTIPANSCLDFTLASTCLLFSTVAGNPC